MWTALRFTVTTFIMAGLVYPLTLTLLGQALFPHQANGSLLHSGSQVVGSALIGQPFSRPEYFHPRPSTNNYDGANSGGANFGATNRKLIERIQKDLAAYRQENPKATTVPVDAVTASGSGLDPHISLANALAQVPRVAQARKLEPELVKKIVLQTTEHPLLSQVPSVNVLQLNLALDQQFNILRNLGSAQGHA